MLAKSVGRLNIATPPPPPATPAPFRWWGKGDEVGVGPPTTFTKKSGYLIGSQISETEGDLRNGELRGTFAHLYHSVGYIFQGVAVSTFKK